MLGVNYVLSTNTSLQRTVIVENYREIIRDREETGKRKRPEFLRLSVERPDLTDTIPTSAGYICNLPRSR
jgi:hypothetical protein